MNFKNYLPEKPTKIAVAMSGGVDSNVTAYLLSQMGHELVGFTAWTLNGPGKCCNDALVNAGRVCEMLNIPYDTVDLRAEFSHYVMDYYHNSYKAGLTPNPCVECNQYVKWDKLVQYAREELDVEYVATGHYAQVTDRNSDGLVNVFRSIDERKDQTYMMARVSQQDYQHALFPLGHMTKPEVVEIAKHVDIPEADGKESQDICFVLDGHAKYMGRQFGEQKGPIIDIDQDKVIGEHPGFYGFTIGQRRGVNVAANRPVYVIKVDPKNNAVFVGDKQHLETSKFRVLSSRWLQPRFENDNNFPLKTMVKFRYNTPPAMAEVTLDPNDDDALIVQTDAPVMAITPGQIAAFYDENFVELWGGGYIEKFIPQQTFDPEKAGELPDLNCELLPA